MKKQSTHIDFRALALAILIFFAFGAKQLHHFWAHAHEEVKICDAKKGETHLHNEEYIHSQCSLCDFTFSTFELQILVFVLKTNIYTTIEGEFSFQSSFFSNIRLSKPARGPPAPMSI